MGEGKRPQSTLPLQAAAADRTTDYSAPTLSPPPPPPGSEPNPTGMQPGHMRCGDGGRASPPAPQGDPAPSCPDAVTKVTGEFVSSSAPAPQSFAEAEPGPSPRAGTGENSQGRAFRFPSPRLVFRIGRSSNEHHRHSPSRPLQQPPLRLWPHPLLQHEVTASQSGRARENTSDTDWLHGPPLPLPTPLTERSGSLWSKKTETAISGKDPRKQEPQSPCHFTGETLYSLAFPFVLR